MTRLNNIYTRFYINGYDLSGYAINTGDFGFEHDTAKVAAYSDAVKNVSLGMTSIKLGPVNAFLAPSATVGLHELMKSGAVDSDVMIAMGTDNEPVVGQPVFAWRMQQTSYKATGADIVGANIEFGGAAYDTVKGYWNPNGLLVHAKGAETAPNTAVATIDYGAQQTKGGVFAYQMFSSNGTATLKLQDASTNSNGSFADLSGATSGSIDASTTPKSGFVALSVTATINRYLRWQIALGTATTCTFACAFLLGV